MKMADLEHSGWALRSRRFCSGRCLRTLMERPRLNTVKSGGNNRGLLGDLVPLLGKGPEGPLLSCILKELFSQNKAAQSVIRAPR